MAVASAWLVATVESDVVGDAGAESEPFPIDPTDGRSFTVAADTLAGDGLGSATGSGADSSSITVAT